MFFVSTLHGIQLKPEVSKQHLASNSRSVHIQVLYPFLPYAVYVGLGPARKKNHMSFLSTLHGIQLNPKVSKQHLASSFRSVHIQVPCPLLPYAVYVGLGPNRRRRKIICVFFSHYTACNSNLVNEQLLATSSRSVHI